MKHTSVQARNSIILPFVKVGKQVPHLEEAKQIVQYLSRRLQGNAVVSKYVAQKKKPLFSCYELA